jgi:hypothetical protein
MDIHSGHVIVDYILCAAYMKGDQARSVILQLPAVISPKILRIPYPYQYIPSLNVDDFDSESFIPHGVCK